MPGPALARRWVLAAVAFATACQSPTALDRADLQNALLVDTALDAVLTKADEAERAGRDDAAADILKRTGGTAADEAVAAAERFAPRSEWGKKEKVALVALEHERKDELARYEKALRSGDPNDKLAALTQQLAIEQRVKTLAEEVDRGP